MSAGRLVSNLDELGPFIVINATTDEVVLRWFGTESDASMHAATLNSLRSASAGDIYAVLSEDAAV